MDLIITILAVVTKDLPISPRFTPYNFLSRCKFSTLTTRQPMVEFSIIKLPYTLHKTLKKRCTPHYTIHYNTIHYTELGTNNKNHRTKHLGATWRYTTLNLVLII